MRPEIAKRKVRTLIWNEFIVEGKLETEPISYIVERLKETRPELEKLYEKSLLRDEDNRSGIETYGYKSESSIKSNLNYISDRWNCSFRIRWLLDLSKREDNIIEEER